MVEIAPLFNKVSVKTPPPHHGGDSAHVSSINKQQTYERENNHTTTKEQAQIIANSICLFFDTSLTLHSTKPQHTPQSLLTATKLHMTGDSSGLTMIQASVLRQLLETAHASLLSQLEDMVIFDTEATRAVSYDEKEFLGPIRQTKKRLAGIGAGLDVVGSGMIRWEFRDDKGKPLVVEVEGYFVPMCRLKLLSPQQYSRETNGGRLISDKDRATYEGVDGQVLNLTDKAMTLLDDEATLQGAKHFGATMYSVSRWAKFTPTIGTR